MRVNVYSQELTDEVEIILKGIYPAVQFTLRSSEHLHDDDKSAVSFWLPKSPERRERLARTFENAATLIRNAPDETE